MGLAHGRYSVNITPFLKQMELPGRLHPSKGPPGQGSSHISFFLSSWSQSGRMGTAASFLETALPAWEAGIGWATSFPSSQAGLDDWAGSKETPCHLLRPPSSAISSLNNPELIQDQKHESARPLETLQPGPCCLCGDVEAQDNPLQS